MMDITNIKDVIKEKNIVIFSPHYDDFIFMMCGYFEELKQNQLLDTKNVTSVLIFGRSNYMNAAGDKNYDMSLERIKYVTGHRFMEDTEALNDLLGRYNYNYISLLEDEALTRGRFLADSDMEFAQGSYESFNDDDRAIFSRMEKVIEKWAIQEDTALVFPIAVKEHIDHFITREAAINIANKLKDVAKASFYFQEDKPYFGIATEEEKERVFTFAKEHNLKPITYKHHPEKCVEVMFTHYVTQCDEIFKTGIRNRADELKNEMNAMHYCDRIYKF